MPGDNQSQNDNQQGNEGYRNLLTRYNNDLGAVAAELYSQTARLREDRRTLQTQLTELQGKAPAADALILTGTQKDAFEAYKKLGKPDELKTTLAAKTEAEQRLAQYERQESINQAAGTVFNAKAIARFLPADARIEAADEVKDGKTQKVYSIVTPVAEGEPKRTPLTDWVTAQETELGLSLKVEPAKPAPTGHGSTPPAGPLTVDQIADEKAKTGQYRI